MENKESMDKNMGSDLANAMLAEFQHEFETTKRFLERLPEDKLTWQPHEKSMTAGQLAFHMASMLKGVLGMALQDNPELPNTNGNIQPTTKAEIIQALNESGQFVSNNLLKIDDERMKHTVSMSKDGKVVLQLPRSAFLRFVLFNHLYHHRGQFGVYLRLLGAPVPSSYGPSADEAPQM